MSPRTPVPPHSVRLTSSAKKEMEWSCRREEIEALVNAYTKGDIPDYQVSAWLMAVVLRGMTPS